MLFVTYLHALLSFTAWIYIFQHKKVVLSLFEISEINFEISEIYFKIYF